MATSCASRRCFYRCNRPRTYPATRQVGRSSSYLPISFRQSGGASPDQAPFERCPCRDVLLGDMTEHFFQVARVESVGGPNRSDILLREDIAGFHVAHHKQRAAKMAAIGLRWSSLITRAAQRFLGCPYPVHHASELCGLHGKRRVRCAGPAREREVLFDDTST